MEDLRISDAARLTGLSRSTILKKIKCGDIASYKKQVPWGDAFRDEYRIHYEALLPYITMGIKNEGISPKDLITLLTIIHKDLQYLKEKVNKQTDLIQQLMDDCKNEEK